MDELVSLASATTMNDEDVNIVGVLPRANEDDWRCEYTLANATLSRHSTFFRSIFLRASSVNGYNDRYELRLTEGPGDYTADNLRAFGCMMEFFLGETFSLSGEEEEIGSPVRASLQREILHIATKYGVAGLYELGLQL